MAIPATPASDPASDKPPCPRRWIPLTLRMYVAILGVLGLGSALLFGRQSYRQFSVIERLERTHLVAGTMRSVGHVGLLRDGRGWLRSQIGDHLMKSFDPPRSVSLGREFGDADLVELAAFPRLETLDLTNAGISDEGLKALRTLTGLKSLRIERTAITDAGMIHIGRLVTLDRLELIDTGITDAGLVLGKANTKITDAGVSELQRALPVLVIAE